MNDLISVIMPVRDAGPYLHDAVVSILDQSHTQLELLLVDDHSNDRAIAELAIADPRLRLLANPGSGLVDALNFGFARAQGDYLARMDGDDLAEPQRLRVQLDYLQRNPAIDIAGAQVRIFGELLGAGGRRYQDWLNSLCEPAAIIRELFIESPLAHPTAMLRRSAWSTLGGYTRSDGPEDYDLWLRAAQAGLAMGKPTGVLLHWRDHARRLTRCDGRYRTANFWATKARHLLAWRSANRPLLIWGAGPTGKAIHDALRAQGCAPDRLLGFVDLHPRRIGGRKRGLPVSALDGVLTAPAGTLVLIAVGSAGVRQEIRDWFEQHGRIEGADYLFVA